MPAELERYDFLKFPSEEEFGILMPEDGALAKKQTRSPEDLVDMPLILPERVLVQKGLGRALCLRLECNYEGLKFVPLAPPSLELGAALA